MQGESTPKLSAPSKHSWQTPLIAVSCGMLATVLVYAVGRAIGFEYWREAGMAAFYLVGIPVSGYRTGSLKTRPVGVILFAVILAAISIVVMNWGRELTK